MNTLKFKDIVLLADLFGTPEKDFYIYDPTSLVEGNHSNHKVFKELEELKSGITEQSNGPITLFNFSNEELLDIYCDEKIGAIIKVNQQGGAAFNPFATYYFLFDEEGQIESILSPGAKKISLSLPKSGGIATRIQQTVKQQGIKIGLQKYIANGSFTFYYKNQHPAEQHLKQKDFDGYTIDISRAENKLLATINSWKTGRLVESHDAQLFHSLFKETII